MFLPAEAIQVSVLRKPLADRQLLRGQAQESSPPRAGSALTSRAERPTVLSGLAVPPTRTSAFKQLSGNVGAIGSTSD
jgi:hypothetical protein